MTYLNGKEVLPAELLAQIQQYCSGGLIYIPQEEGTRRAWGNGTGIRQELDERNCMIREKRRNGSSLMDLAEEFHLSTNSLKKILYAPAADRKM